MLVSILNNINIIRKPRLFCQLVSVLVCLGLASCTDSRDAVVAQDQFLDDDPSSEFQALSALLGEVTFEFALTDSITLFTLTAVFSAVEVSDQERDQIVALGRLSSRTGDDQQPVDNGERLVDCVYVVVDSLYLCSVSFVDDAAGFFAFPPLVDSSSTGTFEFCLSNNRLSSCLGELVDTPDGNVSVGLQLVEPPSSPESVNKVFLNLGDGYLDNSAEMLLVYEKQSSVNADNQ